MKKAKFDKMGRSEVANAVIEGRLDELVAAISRGVDVNRQDKNGWTALHFAAQNQDEAAIRTLLDAGADIDVRDNYGNTPLFRAVFSYSDSGTVIAQLLERGADRHLENNSGVSPFELAINIANYDSKAFFG